MNCTLWVAVQLLSGYCIATTINITNFIQGESNGHLFNGDASIICERMSVCIISECYSLPRTQTGSVVIEGLALIQPNVYYDVRGYFYESYNLRDMRNQGFNMEFVQENQSKSKKGVIRGLHFQKAHPQGKLVRVIRGTVFDVAVDIRKGSNTYGKWYGIILTEDNKLQFYVPEGFAHGFLVLSDEAEFCYKVTDYYYPEDEGSLRWNDGNIGIEWPLAEVGEIILSEKDRLAPPLNVNAQ